MAIFVDMDMSGAQRGDVAGDVLMLTTSRGVAAFGLGLTLGLTALAAPSFAQHADEHMNGKRAAAVHDCSMRAQKMPQPTWGNAQNHMFRSCMMEHGEQE